MARHRIPLRHFPPRVPLWPGLLVGAVVAVTAHVLHKLRLLGLPGEEPLLHPWLLAGYGLATSVAVSFLVELMRLSARARELDEAGAKGDYWAGQAVARAVSNLSANSPEREARLKETRDRWGEDLDRRWWIYYAMAMAAVLPGLQVAILNLRALSAQELAAAKDVVLPAVVASLAALFVGLTAFLVRMSWDRLFRDWMTAALETSGSPQDTILAPPQINHFAANSAPGEPPLPPRTPAGVVVPGFRPHPLRPTGDAAPPIWKPPPLPDLQEDT